MKILITGTSGQLGSEIGALLSGENEILGLDLHPGKQTTYIGNLLDRDLIYSLTKGIDAVIHTASLHAPHLGKHKPEEFIDTNIKGTLNLLQASVENGVSRFIYTSTTSLYGYAMVSSEKAVWVTESLVPQPRDIYDVTKIAAENLCQSMSRHHGLPCLCLRVSRYFEEPQNLMAIYRLYRGVDVRDAARAHLLALRSEFQGFEIFNISALSPFSEDEVRMLRQDAPRVLAKHFPDIEMSFRAKGWVLPQSIDRVYVIEKARKVLGYQPQYNFDVFLP